MRHFAKYVCLVVSVLLLLGVFAGCSSQDSSAVYLDYQTGLDDAGRWDSDYFMKNGSSDVDCADPGCFYVSEEEDPVWGGYYYRYQTGQTSSFPVADFYMMNSVTTLVSYCDRSKDLSSWEPVGALDGFYCMAVRSTDWCKTNFWAPEVIRNPNDGKYYFYFSAEVSQDHGVPYVSSSASQYDRRHLGIAVSDSPAGPFLVINDYDEEYGQSVPTVNFQKGLNLDYNIAAIDAHPFFDVDGSFYLYFVHHGDDHSNKNKIAGVKMEDMAHPVYDTYVELLQPNVATVNTIPGSGLNSVPVEDYFYSEGSVNEGPFMYYHAGKYYLTYSANGYTSISYSVHQSVGDSPLGPFRKLSAEEGNPLLDGSLYSSFYGTGHHSFVKAGDELWIVYHRHAGVYHGIGWSRPAAADRVNFVTNADGLDIMTINGPSKILMWKPEALGEYRNFAAEAQISANRGTGTQYLADEVLPYYDAVAHRTYTAENGQVKITLRWDEPVEVSSVMIYNSVTVDRAFSQIAELRFELAEQPEWASKNYAYAVIENLPIEADGWNPDSEDYLQFAPAVAVFDPIKVNSITVTVNESDRLMEFDRFGEPQTGVDVGEIIVLGGKEQ